VWNGPEQETLEVTTESQESAWVSRSTKAFGALPSRSLKVDGEICAKERLDLELSAFEARSSYLMGRRGGASLVKAATNSL
jgi:hypothetical protein